MINPYELGLPDPATAIAAMDLEAQQSMAWWTRAMFWATIVSLLLSAGALAGLLISLRQTSRALREARMNNELQTQAYAYVSELKFGGHGRVIAYCENQGLTPATHFVIAAEAQRVAPGGGTAPATFKNDEFSVWSRLEGGEPTTVSLPIRNPDLVRTFQDGKFRQTGDLLVIVGILSYTTIHNHDHESHFMFYIDDPRRQKFSRPPANLPSFHRIKDDNRDFKKFPTIWSRAT